MQQSDVGDVLNGDIDTAVADLTGGGIRPVSPAIAETICRRLAHHAYNEGRRIAITELMDVPAAAEFLGVSPRRVRQLALSRNLGWQVSRGTWLFRPDDLAIMQERRVGRPKRKP